MDKLRNDGRFVEEFRTMDCVFRKLENKGLICWRQGNSIVNTTISQNRDKQQLSLSINFLESSRNDPINERRLYGMRQKILGIFTPLIVPDNQVDITVEVVGDDGSMLSVIINSITLACMCCGINLSDMCLSVTLDEGVDLNYQEEGRGFAVCVVFSPNRDKILHLESFGALQQGKFEEAVKLGVRACKALHGKFREIALDAVGVEM